MKKTCTKCGEEKDFSKFSKNGNGLYSHCKSCRSIYRKKNYIHHPIIKKSSKICTKCKEEKDLSNFYIVRIKDTRNGCDKTKIYTGYASLCKICSVLKNKEYRKTHKQPYNRQYRVNWYKNQSKESKEKYRETQREWERKNKIKRYQRKKSEKFRTWSKIYYKKYGDNCLNHDHYIAKVLRLPVNDLRQYPELIKLKREIIKANRVIKELS